MNIKYVSLLSVLVITGANAMSSGKKLEHAKNELRKCEKSLWKIDCNQQEEAYQNAKQEFVIPFRKITEDGIEANQELYFPSKSSLFGFRKNNKNELEEKRLLAYAASGLMEALIVRNGPKFEWDTYDNKSLEQYCDDVLDIFVVNRPPSSLATDKMGKSLDANDIQLAKTKATLKEIIKKQIN